MRIKKTRDYDKVLQAEYEKGRVVKFAVISFLMLAVLFLGALIVDIIKI